MKKITKIFISLAIFLMLTAPALSLAAWTPGNPLVPCGKGTVDAAGKITDACDFDALLLLINNVITFILFYMAIPIAAIMFFYAGFELVTSGGSTEKRGLAKKVFTNAAIGLALAMACWLIVKTILSILGYNGTWIGF